MALPFCIHKVVCMHQNLKASSLSDRYHGNTFTQAWKDMYIANYTLLSRHGAWSGGNKALLAEISGILPDIGILSIFG